MNKIIAKLVLFEGPNWPRQIFRREISSLSLLFTATIVPLSFGVFIKGENDYRTNAIHAYYIFFCWSILIFTENGFIFMIK